jgi:hypothetical protein
MLFGDIFRGCNDRYGDEYCCMKGGMRRPRSISLLINIPLIFRIIFFLHNHDVFID